MPTLSGTNELREALALILKNINKSTKGAISAEDQVRIIDTLVPAIQAGGGIDPKDPKSVENLKQGIKTVMLMAKVYNDPKLSPANKEALDANHKDLLAGIFAKSPTPEQTKKLTIAVAYLKVLDNDPGKDISLGLAMKDPAQLKPDEKEKLMADLTQVFAAINKMQKDPLTEAKLAELMKLVKQEIDKPGSTKALANKEDKGLTDTLTNLFGVDPHIPGKVTGPLMVLAGNTMGVVDNYPAMAGSKAPIDSFSGNIMDAAQAATGENAIAASRNDDMGGMESALDSAVDSAMDAMSSALSAVADSKLDAGDNTPEPEQAQPETKLGGLQKIEPPKAQEAAPAPAQEQEHQFKSPFDRQMRPTPPGGK